MADFPILDYVPTFLSPWKRNAIALHQFEVDLYKKLTSGVRRKLANGELPECLMRHLLQNQASYGFDDELVDYAAGTLFGEENHSVSSSRGPN